MNSKTTHQQSTQHTRLRIEQHGDEKHLKFETDVDAIQSAINLKQPHKLMMQNLQYLMGILQFIETPKNILLLGVGGGSLIQFFRHYLPQAHVTGVEYDQELLEMAHQQLNLPREDENLSFVTRDAREFVESTREKFDLIVVDIFEDGQSTSWCLQKPFNQRLKNCLTVNGSIAYNLLIESEQKFSRFYQLMRELYDQQTLCLETEDYENILVYGLNFKTREKSMTQHLERSVELNEQFELPFTQILSVIYDINPQGSGII